MGDVYLAEDTDLDRKIALKVLPPDLAASEKRRARFKREAKAIATLNHPNIVTVYSVEESRRRPLHHHGARAWEAALGADSEAWCYAGEVLRHREFAGGRRRSYWDQARELDTRCAP